MGGRSGCQIFQHGSLLARFIDFLSAKDATARIGLCINGDTVDSWQSQTRAISMRSRNRQTGRHLQRSDVRPGLDVVAGVCRHAQPTSRPDARKPRSRARAAVGPRTHGIPLVLASQFPISFAGSVVMTETLYQGLLWGTDPRNLVVHVRRALRSRVPKTHDWASVVNYVSFPAKLDDQLRDYRFRQAHRALEAVVSHLDFAIQGMSAKEQDAQPAAAGRAQSHRALSQASERSPGPARIVVQRDGAQRTHQRPDRQRRKARCRSALARGELSALCRNRYEPSARATTTGKRSRQTGGTRGAWSRKWCSQWC
jgi:hypothetical protein